MAKEELDFKKAWDHLVSLLDNSEDRNLLAIVFEIAEYGLTTRTIPEDYICELPTSKLVGFLLCCVVSLDCVDVERR